MFQISTKNDQDGKNDVDCKQEHRLLEEQKKDKILYTFVPVWEMKSTVIHGIFAK